MDNAFSVIMKSFLEPVRLGTDSILQDGNKSQNSDWERVVLNLKEDGSRILKKLVFSNNVTYTFQ